MAPALATLVGDVPGEPGGLFRAGSRPEVLGISVSDPDRVVFPDVGLTKVDLARYYERISELMVPRVLDRPLMMRRCPEGQGKPCFFQKHPSVAIPEVLGRVEVVEKKGPDTYLTVKDAAGLVALAQIGVLEIHLWGSRADRGASSGRRHRRGPRARTAEAGSVGGDGVHAPGVDRHDAARRRRRPRADVQPLTISPPFGCSTCPVKYEPSSLARKT